MLREKLPPVVIGGIQLLIRRLEKRDVLFLPAPIPVIPPVEALQDVLGFQNRREGWFQDRHEGWFPAGHEGGGQNGGGQGG
jgi:hypothetical protein